MFVHEVPRKFNLCVCVLPEKKKDRLTQFLRLALKYAPWKLVSNYRLGPLRAFVDMHEFKKIHIYDPILQINKHEDSLSRLTFYKRI